MQLLASFWSHSIVAILTISISREKIHLKKFQFFLIVFLVQWNLVAIFYPFNFPIKKKSKTHAFHPKLPILTLFSSLPSNFSSSQFPRKILQNRRSFHTFRSFFIRQLIPFLFPEKKIPENAYCIQLPNGMIFAFRSKQLSGFTFIWTKVCLFPARNKMVTLRGFLHSSTKVNLFSPKTCS